jgi:hypothetical protein
MSKGRVGLPHRPTTGCALASLRSSALRTSASSVTPLAELRKRCAVQGLALRVTHRFHRGHDAEVHPRFSHAQVSLVSVRSGGLRQRERYGIMLRLAFDLSPGTGSA